MTHLHALPVSTLALLVAATACAPDSSGQAAGERQSVEVTMVLPVTTSSEEARQHFLAGQHALDMGRPRLARPHFEKAVELDPDFALAHRNLVFTGTSLAASLAALGRASSAKGKASPPERLLIEITEAFRENDAERQHALARELVEMHPESPRAWMTLAGVQTGMSRTGEARASLRRAVETSPDFAAAQIQLANSYLLAEPHDMVAAETAVRRAIELAPDESMPHDLLGDVHRMRGELEEAGAAYSRAAELDPENALPLQQRGHVHSFLGNWDQARRDYDAAIALGVDDEPSTFAVFRSFVNVHAGEPEAAIRELDELLARIDGMGLPDPRGGRIFALTSQAQIALHEGMLDEAERILRDRAELLRANAVEIGTDQARRDTEATVLEWEARLAARRGQHEAAKGKVGEAMTLRDPIHDPTKNADAHEVMGLVSLLQRQYGEAVAHYEQGDRDDIYANFHHALALEGAGRTEEAQRLFRKVAEWRFNDLGLALTRGDARRKISA